MHFVLPPSFYLNENVVEIARMLLGKYIVTKKDGLESWGMIVETEAYRAPDDKACHAFGNRLTNRTKTMFSIGGTAYVYTCYGMHPLFNVVTGPEGTAHAVLIRAVELDKSLPQYLERRSLSQFSRTLSNGPGKLAVCLGISKSDDGTILTDLNSSIKIEDRGIQISDDRIEMSARVGMSKHTGPCANRLWRFYIKDNLWVSRPLLPDYSKFGF